MSYPSPPKERILSEKGKMIAEYIQTNPGLTSSEIRRNLSLTYGQFHSYIVAASPRYPIFEETEEDGSHWYYL